MVHWWTPSFSECLLSTSLKFQGHCYKQRVKPQKSSALSGKQRKESKTRWTRASNAQVSSSYHLRPSEKKTIDLPSMSVTRMFLLLARQMNPAPMPWSKSQLAQANQSQRDSHILFRCLMNTYLLLKKRVHLIWLRSIRLPMGPTKVVSSSSSAETSNLSSQALSQENRCISCSWASKSLSGRASTQQCTNSLPRMLSS